MRFLSRFLLLAAVFSFSVATESFAQQPDDGPGGGRRPQGQDGCLLYTSPSPRDRQKSRMPSSA